MTLKRAQEIHGIWDRLNNEEPPKDWDDLFQLTSEEAKCTKSECEKANFMVQDERYRLQNIEFEKQYFAWETGVVA